MIDPALMEYATARQREVLQAVIDTGSGVAAAAALGICRSYPQKILRAVSEKAARQGYSPAHDMTRTVPEGYTVKGVSTYYDSDGKPRGQWVKSRADDVAREAMLRAAIDAMAGEVAPCQPVAAPGDTLADLLTQYTITDLHIGALCWHREGGADWDTGIAERTASQAMAALVDGAPASERAVVALLGDLLHHDGLASVTPASGHVLDADSRFGRIVEVAIRLVRKLVATALAKHDSVTLLIIEGNHDPASSVWLRKLFGALYEGEPRVTVQDDELPYSAIEFGANLLGFHHGHLRKNDQLPALFAAQFRAAWGRCEHVTIHTGHRHHKEDRDHGGARVVQHPTIAARDAYAARGGWFSARAMTAMTFHRRFGEVGTVIVNPSMLEAA